MHIAILGRQPALGMAELESLYGAGLTKWFSDISAVVSSGSFAFDRLGGTQKAGRIIAELPRSDWRRASMQIVQHYVHEWGKADGKITLGISAYGFDVSPRDIQKTGIILKNKLKEKNISLRLVPNAEPALNSATSHHNKLGLSSNKVELLVVRARDGRVIVAESIGAQNITAYTRRDQERPKRDAFVGMLPPKLAQIIINLATPLSVGTESNHLQPEIDATSGPDINPGAKPIATSNDRKEALRILDPFCGTGVILQEAALMGYDVYGTDLADKMVDYSHINLEWLKRTHHVDAHDITLHQSDATTTTWQQPINSVACEGYLGQPFSAPPSAEKLAAVQKNCDHIMSSFLKNIAPQLTSGTPLCVAIPAWRGSNGQFTHLPLIQHLEALGYKRHAFENIKNNELLYYREDQVVARELLVLARA